ncbi:MAG: DUF4362 domain-containing protein [Oscillospiraceae bacterium]|nr:DUF4362 domain-containing protein [Oscillospiraceae bacterium]
MSSIIRAIIVMSISGSALTALLFILKPLVRNRLPKSAQYYLWLVVVAALLIPVSRLVALPSANSSSPILVSPLSVVDRYVVSSLESSERIAALPEAQGQPESNNHNIHKVNQETSPAATVIDIFMLIYPFGAAIALLYFIVSYSVFINLHCRRNKDANAEETSMLVRLCGNRRVPRLYRNPLAITPMLIGVLHPMIILPDRDYTDEQLHSVLRHELTHHKRKDVFIKWLSVLACAVHWFNPIIWLVRREIDHACELACDEAVILGLDNTGKQIYGDTLLYVAADAKMPHAVLSTTMCEEKKALKERLGAIMKSKKHTRSAVILSAALIVAATLTACALGAGRASNQDSRELIEFEAIYSDVTEDSYCIEFKYGDIHYSPYIVDGLLQSVGSTRGLSEVGFAVCDFSGTVREGQKNEYRIFEREGYPIDEFIIVQDRMTFMNPATIYVAATMGFGQITLDELRELAAKGDALQYSDFPFQMLSLSSQLGGHNPTVYGVEGGYRLVVNFKDTLNPDDGIGSVSLERIWDSGGSGIDIRYSDVDEFIRTHPSNPALTDIEALAIAQGYTGKHLTIIDLDWWEFADEFPNNSTDPEKQKLFEALDAIPETCHLFIADDGSFIAVGKRYGTVYNYDTATGFTLAEIPGDAVQSTTPSTYEPLMSSWRPLSDLPTDYTKQQAIADGVYVNVHGLDIYNQQQVDRFFDDVAAGGGAAFMRVMQYTIEGDAIITDYQYDGNVFTVTHDSTRGRFSSASNRVISTMTYKYLVQFDHSRIDGDPFPYFLSNEEKIYTVTADGQGAALIDDLWWVPSPSGIDRTDYGIGGATSSVDLMNGKIYVNLTRDSLVVGVSDLPDYQLYTNSERITVSIPRGDYAGTLYLYATDHPEDFIMTFELNRSNHTKTFSNLTSARNYFLRANGLDESVLVTVTD